MIASHKAGAIFVGLGLVAALALAYAAPVKALVDRPAVLVINHDTYIASITWDTRCSLSTDQPPNLHEAGAKWGEIKTVCNE